METINDRLKNLGFRDFTTVDYTMTGDEYLAYQAQKRKRGHYDTYNEGVEETDEALSHSQRVKASQRMKRMSKRIQVAKKRALKRAPSMDVLKKRAQKQARTDLLKKWTRGAEKSELSFGRRQELEKKLKKAKSKIDRNAKRLMPQMRQKDRERRAGQNTRPEDKK